MKKDDIDILLKEWDSKIQFDEKSKEDIQNAVEAGIKRKDIIPFPDENYFVIHKRYAYAAGIAAMLCIAFIAGIVYNRKTTGESPQSLAMLSVEEIQNLKRLSSEVNHLFPEGIRWISQVDNGDPVFETGKSESLEDRPETRILVRYIVLKKEERGKWEQVHLSDIITAPGEAVRLKGENQGYIWTHQVDKNVYALESQLKLKAGDTILDLEYSGGQNLQTPQNIKTIRRAGSEYRIYQTISKI